MNKIIRREKRVTENMRIEKIEIYIYIYIYHFVENKMGKIIISPEQIAENIKNISKSMYLIIALIFFKLWREYITLPSKWRGSKNTELRWNTTPINTLKSTKWLKKIKLMPNYGK